MTQAPHTAELPHESPMSYSDRIYNRAADGPRQARIDCAAIASDADTEIAALRSALTEAAADARRLSEAIELIADAWNNLDPEHLIAVEYSSLRDRIDEAMQHSKEGAK